jgi:hypothetical protein
MCLQKMRKNFCFHILMAASIALLAAMEAMFALFIMPSA